MKNYTMLLTILFLLSLSIYAQEAESNRKKTKEEEGAKKIDSPQATGDDIKFLKIEGLVFLLIL